MAPVAKGAIKLLWRQYLSANDDSNINQFLIGVK